MKTFYLVDGHAQIFRAYYAPFASVLSAPSGEPTKVLIAVATGGLVINLIGLWVLEGGRSDSLNVRGAFLHVLSDTLASVGVILSGFLAWWGRWEFLPTLWLLLLGLFGLSIREEEKKSLFGWFETKAGWRLPWPLACREEK